MATNDNDVIRETYANTKVIMHQLNTIIETQNKHDIRLNEHAQRMELLENEQKKIIAAIKPLTANKKTLAKWYLLLSTPTIITTLLITLWMVDDRAIIVKPLRDVARLLLEPTIDKYIKIEYSPSDFKESGIR